MGDTERLLCPGAPRALAGFQLPYHPPQKYNLDKTDKDLYTNITRLGKSITKKQIEKLYRNSITVPRSEQDDRNCFIELLEYIVNPLQNYSNDKNEE